jgi:hypothetical protein
MLGNGWICSNKLQLQFGFELLTKLPLIALFGSAKGVADPEIR